MHALRLSEQNNNDLFGSAYNVGMSSNVVQADLAILLERYLLCNRVYEKKLYARIMALTILVYLDDVNNLLGRDLLCDLSKVGFKEFVLVFKEINKAFSKIKKDHGTLLREIRNNSLAHKAKSADILYHFVYELDSEPIYKLAVEVYELSNTITIADGALSTRIAKEYTRLASWFHKIEETMNLKSTANK